MGMPRATASHRASISVKSFFMSNPVSFLIVLTGNPGHSTTQFYAINNFNFVAL